MSKEIIETLLSLYQGPTDTNRCKKNGCNNNKVYKKYCEDHRYPYSRVIRTCKKDGCNKTRVARKYCEDHKCKQKGLATTKQNRKSRQRKNVVINVDIFAGVDEYTWRKKMIEISERLFLESLMSQPDSVMSE